LDELVWDAGNLAHLAQRNTERRAMGEATITRRELNRMHTSGRFSRRDVEYLTRRGVWEWQVHLTGRTPAGRYLTVACGVLLDGRLRPITTWEAAPHEIAQYREDQPHD
jgi:hypothetical protein